MKYFTEAEMLYSGNKMLYVGNIVLLKLCWRQRYARKYASEQLF